MFNLGSAEPRPMLTTARSVRLLGWACCQRFGLQCLLELGGPDDTSFAQNRELLPGCRFNTLLNDVECTYLPSRITDSICNHRIYAGSIATTLIQIEDPI